MRILEKIFIRLPLPTYPYEMYMHKYKCLFVHIPKNAGSSIIKTMGHEKGRSHVQWNHFIESNSRWFRRYHKFAICREPLDRLLSGYNYIINGGNQSEKDLALKKEIETGCNNIDEFIEKCLSYEFMMENIIFAPQYLFVFNDRHECMMDTILRFESLSKDWLMLANKHQLPASLKIENVTNNAVRKNKTNPQLKPENILKVKALYHRDYQLFDY